MIAVDTNVLIYAHVTTFPLHSLALARVTELAQAPDPWAVPVFCLTEFLRVVTHPRLFDRPFTSRQACDALEALQESPSLLILHPGERYVPLLLDTVRESGAAGNLIFDAQIVAVCREAGVRDLLTEDRDFARFPAIRTTRLGD